MRRSVLISAFLLIAMMRPGFAQPQPVQGEAPPIPAEPPNPLEAPATPEEEEPSPTAALPSAQEEEQPPPTPVVSEEPAPIPPAAPPPNLTVEYKKGLAITSADGQYSLELGVRGQLRAEFLRPEAADEIQSHFLIPRLRVQIEGRALGPSNRYKVEFDLAGSGNPGLRDYFVEHEFSPALRVRLGQWKRPFNRQELSSDFASDFIERSITNGANFGNGGRDLGIALHNGYDKSPAGLEWALGVFNGTGDRSQQTLRCTDAMDITTCTIQSPSNVPTDFGPIVVARVGWNHGDIKGYNEGDLDGGPLRFAVGASYKGDLRDLDEDDAGDLQIQHGAEADFIVKVEGADVSGAAFLIKSGSADPLLGFYGQAGYFVMPKLLQVAARFSMYELPTDANRLEALGALNWYFQGHSYKWMTDAGILQTTGDAGVTDFQARTQLQFVF